MFLQKFLLWGILKTMEKIYDLIIIGGGAGGLAAGVTACKRGKKVLLVEGEDKVGKKILVTGNGKCNLSNVNVNAEKYNTPYATNVLDVDVVAFFADLGMATKRMDDRIYPYSESALSVVNALRKNFTGDVILSSPVAEIEKKDDLFFVLGYKGKAVLLATGSAATKGKDSTSLLQKFGHTVTPMRPSVVPLLTDTEYVKPIANLRAKGTVKLLKGTQTVKEEKGEILFKTNGISGIASMMLSTFIARDQAKYDVSIDLVDDKTEEEIRPYVMKSGAESFVQKAIAQSVEKQSKARAISVEKCLKDYRITNVRLGEVANAQVMCGGLCTDEFDENFMSKKVNNLYACGEVMDVDGECGGFNLHFAFASGIKVGSVC